MTGTVSVRQAGVARNRDALLAAAAESFVQHGVLAPVRDIAERARVGVGTVYRHFPNRADLVTAVYRHQVNECAALARRLLQESCTPSVALAKWIDAFVEFLVTKHGLGMALQSTDPSLLSLHSLMLDQLVPACTSLLEAGVKAGEFDPSVKAYALMRAVGNLCVLGPHYGRDDAKDMVTRLLAGCRSSQ